MSSKSSSSATARGIGFTGILTVAFIVLKLCGVITWSWVWILSPVWISAILWILFFVIACKLLL